MESPIKNIRPEFCCLSCAAIVDQKSFEFLVISSVFEFPLNISSFWIIICWNSHRFIYSNVSCELFVSCSSFRELIHVYFLAMECFSIASNGRFWQCVAHRASAYCDIEVYWSSHFRLNNFGMAGVPATYQLLLVPYSH